MSQMCKKILLSHFILSKKIQKKEIPAYIIYE